MGFDFAYVIRYSPLQNMTINCETIKGEAKVLAPRPPANIRVCGQW
jgi:hypothetical protein